MADRKITALTELTAPVAADVFPIIDVSESANANKNKKIQLTTILKGIPNGTVSAPSVGFIDDNGATGFFRVASNEIGISANQGLIGSFTTTGFQLGSGTPAAQLHLFSTDTTDQVIIENTSDNADNAPDLVLFRNSASPAADDNLGNLVYRGEDAAGNAHDYASVVASIETTTDGSEDGILDIMSSASGTLASRIRLKNNKVGIGESDPIYPMHLTTTLTGQALQLQCDADDAASGANLMLYHRRGASGAGQDNDVISTIFYRGKNDAGTPEEIDFVGLEGVITDASDGTEDGKLNLQVMTAGTLTTKLAIDATGINITGTVTDDGAVHDGNVDLNGNIDVSGTSTLNNDVTFTGASANILFDKSDNALEFAHDAKSIYGDAANFQIYHNANGSFISHEATAAKLFIQTNSSAGIEINKGVSENIAKFIPDGAVEAYFDNVKRFETSATGINITGTVVDDGATHDGDVTFTGASANVVFDKSDNALEFANDAKAVFGDNGELQIFRSGTESLILENQGNNLNLAANRIALLRADRHTVMLLAIANGAVELYHNNAKKAATSANGFDLPDNSKLGLGDSQDLEIYHNGTDSFIENSTGNVHIRSKTGEEAIKLIPDSAVQIYHDNAIAIHTQSWGNQLYGTLQALGDIEPFLASADTTTAIRFKNNTGEALKIIHQSSNSFITNNVGSLFIEAKNGEKGIAIIPDAAVELYHNNVKKAETSATGFDVPLDFVSGSGGRITVGASQDLTFFHDSTNSYVQNHTGDLIIGDTNHIYVKGYTSDKSAGLWFNNSEKIRTTNSGVTVTGTVTETSDIAFKSDIEPITNTLDKLQQITGYKYKLDNASIDSMGVIAQDVEKVFPELVHGDEGSKTLQYSGLIGVLVEAVKDLSAKVKKLESN